MIGEQNGFGVTLSVNEATTNAYAAGVSHYASPGRRDSVKQKWEEPVTHEIIATATGPVPEDSPLRVVDIGCGGGDGLRLFTEALPEAELDYHGIDIDEALLALGRDSTPEGVRALFSRGDMLYDIPDHPADVYFSCGVPYSHLTEEELGHVLRQIFGKIRSNRTSSTVVVDVLGRYSIEWWTKWQESRWDYRMSFFHNGEESVPTPMSFWDSQSLIGCIGRASRDSSTTVNTVSFHDRSIMTGRHTTTGEFNPGLAPYRTLVNHLEDEGDDVRAHDLLFPHETPLAPSAITAFHETFRQKWNEVVEKYSKGSVFVPRDRMKNLAKSLRETERRYSPGLGVGHSLTAVITVDQHP
ncbi:class I SAM-dependent methyltransferase [Streptomyces daliensis]|uniref:Class I SAM-dependent methyltransferase n=1 Tax=Streptomyces daliensis TaxID=299421 RepID=A0A8T4IK98_9ACTN|nr:class I SAM-dependent methyltransferase [Streptomyces daliensis]